MGINDTIDDYVSPLEEAARNVNRTDPRQSPMGSLLDALISFLKQLFDPRPDADAPNFEDAGSKEEALKAQKEYEGRKTEESKLPGFKQSALQNLNPATIKDIPTRLMAMREREEAAHGGTVKAVLPVNDQVARITSDFGHRESPVAGASTEHKGLDMAPTTPGSKPDIVAAMPGIVIGAGWKEGYGNTIDILDIYGKTHRYGHLDSIWVTVGESVEQNAKIGVMGKTGRATGVHLHYEQRDEHGVPKPPVILDKEWKDGAQITMAENLAFIHKQTLNAQLAGVDLSHLQGGGYVPPGGPVNQNQPAKAHIG